ncbi:F-box only protein 48-like [Amphiura filiformis]|uniref:F-box only protein 48-like n=1 Tax=Amphiura filiformis TaxID=82378 RepID=UPI003B20CDCF
MSSRSSKPSSDFIQLLPPELAMMVLLNLDIPSLCYASQACQDWHNVIQDTEYLWKLLCDHHCVDAADIAEDRANGYSWKETVMRNFGHHAIKRKWLKGEFSNFSSFEDIPGKHMCCMDVETWGRILDLELSR